MPCSTLMASFNRRFSLSSHATYRACSRATAVEPATACRRRTWPPVNHSIPPRHGGIKQSDSPAGRHERETNHLVAVDGAAVAKSLFRDGAVDGKRLVTWRPDTTVGCGQKTVATTVRQQNRNTFNRHQSENQFEHVRLDFTPIAKRIDPAVELQESIKHDAHFRLVGCLAMAGSQLAVPFLFGR